MTGLDFDAFVLAAATDDLSAEPAARDHADAVEFRLDLAIDPLDQLDAYGGDLPLIITNRAAWEGGEADDEAGRLETLEAALDHEAVAAVDLELGALDGSVSEAATDGARELRATAREAGVSVIASVHDFESTPSVDGMTDLLAHASDEGDIGKLAVTATDRSDALAVLSATHSAVEAGRTVATMAMGAAGQHTRAVAPVYGSAIGYAPVDPEGATAPGQYDLETLRGLVDRLQ
jgi:3-dehydroquinate dehydratase-1